MPVFLNMRSSSNTNINGAPDFGRLLNGALTRAVNTGKDGVVARDIIDGGGMTTHYVVFSPNQIKSATGNSGAFDPKNDDIRFSRGEALSPQEKRLFNEIGELEVGVKAYNKLAGLLKPAFAKIRMANTAPEQFTQMMRDYRAQLNVAGRFAKAVADAGVKMTEAERKLLSDVLEKELPPGVDVARIAGAGRRNARNTHPAKR